MANKKRHEADDFKTAVKMVQQFVNEIVEKKGLSENTVEESCKGVEQIAGKFGNDQDRKKNMKVFNKPQKDNMFNKEDGSRGYMLVEYRKCDDGKVRIDAEFRGNERMITNALTKAMLNDPKVAEIVGIAAGCALVKNAETNND